MKIEIVDDQPQEITLDGYDTTALAISAVDNSRAVCLVYAGFGDAREVAQKLCDGFNHHDELIQMLQRTVETCRLLNIVLPKYSYENSLGGVTKLANSKPLLDCMVDVLAKVQS